MRETPQIDVRVVDRAHHAFEVAAFLSREHFALVGPDQRDRCGVARRLVEQLVAPGVVNAQRLELGLQGAGAGAEDHAVVGDARCGGDGLGGDQRVARGQDPDVGREAQASGDGGHRADLGGGVGEALAVKVVGLVEADGLEADFSAVLLGALLGYMPTVQGNFLFSTRDWLRERDFWRVQNEYLACRRQGMPVQAAAFEAIAPALERTMARRPIPAMIHRRATRDLTLGDLAVRRGEMIVVGLVSAAAESDFSDLSPAFGGNYEDDPKPTHACPGQKLGMGTLLGMIAALFELEGTLRRAPSTSALLYDPS